MGTNKTVYYTKNAGLLQEDNNSCYAKSISNEQFDVYYIKSNGREFFDPNYHKISIEWNFTKVKEEAFNLYIEFLKSGNRRYVELAEKVF